METSIIESSNRRGRKPQNAERGTLIRKSTGFYADQWREIEKRGKEWLLAVVDMAIRDSSIPIKESVIKPDIVIRESAKPKRDPREVKVNTESVIDTKAPIIENRESVIDTPIRLAPMPYAERAAIPPGTPLTVNPHGSPAKAQGFGGMDPWEPGIARPNAQRRWDSYNQWCRKNRLLADPLPMIDAPIQRVHGERAKPAELD